MQYLGRWIGGDFAFVSEAKAEKLQANLARPGDIIVTQRGTLGQVSIVPEQAHFTCYVVSQSQMAVSVDPAFADRDFVYYYLRSPEFTAYSESQTIQTGVPHINLGILREAPTAFPDLKVQIQVSKILSALDDKIELNRKTAATLEEMARALYRSWFVDFDPVWAKTEGRAPAHMATETAALFPDRFDEEALPLGWERKAIGDFFRFQRGLSYKGAFLNDEGRPMLNLGCFGGNGAFDWGKAKGYSGDWKERHIVRAGDLILANTDMTQKRVILGSPHIVEGREGQTFLYSHHVYAARPVVESSAFWARFFYYQLLQPEFRERAEGFATGTTVLFLPADAAEALDVVIPPVALVTSFYSAISPFIDRVRSLEEENKTLVDLRDGLLPKLMSGELRVREAEKQVEAAI